MAVDSNFTDLLKTLAAGTVPKYEITGGGEPFLNRNLQEIIHNLRTALPSAYIKMYTNGQIFRRPHGLDQLNISVAHWDTSINNAIFRLSAPRDLISVLNFFAKDRTYKLRLAIPMIKGGIDSPAKAKEMIDRTSSHVDSYVFRPLFPFTANRAEYDGEFQINDPRVEVDYGACGHDNILVWMPNNRIYKGWSLAEELNVNSSLQTATASTLVSISGTSPSGAGAR